MPKRRSAGIVVSSLLLCRQRAPSLTGALPLALSVELRGVGDRLVVVVRDEVFGDLIRCRLPDPIVGHHIVQNLVQVFHSVRWYRKVGVHGNACYASTDSAL